MKKTSNKNLMGIVVFALIFAVYNACLFIIAQGFEDHYLSFWASYVFMMLAFIDIAVVAVVFKTRGYKAKDLYLAFPVTKHLTIFVIVELIISSIFMAIDDNDIGWLAIVLQLIVLTVHIVFVVLCFMSTETIKEVQQKVKDKTTFIRLLQADAETCAAKANDPQVKAAFNKFAEQVRFSDPMSNENLFELEKMIALQISNADTCISMNDYVTAMQCCERASTLLIERNKKCYALK